jgi:C4-type zinc ribbon domain
LRKLAQFDTELRELSRGTEQFQEMLDKIESQRAPLPTSILVHYDRPKTRSKLAIAPVLQGVCGACHLSIPRDRLADLRHKPAELNVCDNCGAFIYLPNDYKMAATSRAGLLLREGVEISPDGCAQEIQRLFGRSLKLRSVSAGGCSGCELELNALGNVNFDIGRFGIEFVASPRMPTGSCFPAPRPEIWSTRWRQPMKRYPHQN